MSRITAVELNGTAKRARKQAAKTPTAKARAQAEAARRAVAWSHRYTGAAVVLSSGLNGYAAVMESHAEGFVAMAAAGAIGVVIPVLVWMLGTVTAWTWRAGWKRLAAVSGLVACCVLALSVLHVAGALSALTGTNWFLAGLLAVGIDCGLVSSEATAILVSSVEE